METKTNGISAGQVGQASGTRGRTGGDTGGSGNTGGAVGSTASSPTDLRILRTRQCLWKALVDLIGERGYGPLSVSDITARAGINRTTFYRHFEDKNDLFRQGCTDFINGFIDRMRGNFVVTPEADFSWLTDYLSGLFTYMETERATFRILAGQRGNPEFIHITQDLVYNFLVTVRLKDWQAMTLDPGNSVLPSLYARSVTSLLVGLSSWWLQSDQPISAADIGKVYSTLVTKGITGLLRLQL